MSVTLIILTRQFGVSIKMNILITGATGFVGRCLVQHLREVPIFFPKAAVRTQSVNDLQCPAVYVGDISAKTNWHDALTDCNVVIHTAARVHIMSDKSVDPLAEFRRVNVEGTLNLAMQAAEAGVKRFIFISSIKVNGEETKEGQAYTADDDPAPKDPYGISKLEAEQGLQALAADTGMEVVIIRPPLVYGEGVKGNFQTMIKFLKKKIPLPLGLVNNKRSLVGIDNLVNLIVTCIQHPQAANQVFLVSDGQDLSTPELLKKMGHALNIPVRLLPVPFWLINIAAKLIGKGAMVQRLFGSLQVDIVKTRQLLGWSPPQGLDEALVKVVEGTSRL